MALGEPSNPALSKTSTLLNKKIPLAQPTSDFPSESPKYFIALGEPYKATP